MSRTLTWLACAFGLGAASACTASKADDDDIVPTPVVDAPCPPTGCQPTCSNTQTDPANCGWCGHDCGGASCTDGVCAPTVLATMNGGIVATYLDLASGFLYWTNHPSQCGAGGGTCDGLMKCRTTGCAMSPEPFGTFQSPYFLDVEGGAAVVGRTGGGIIYRCSTDGCGTTPATPAMPATLQNLVADANRMAWVDLTTVRSCPNSDAACPTPTTISTVPSGQQYREGLAVADGTVFFATSSTIYAAPIDGSAPARVVVGGLASIFGLTTDGVDVYYGAAGEVGRCAVGGCASATILATPPTVARQVAVDAKHVYIRTDNGNASTIERCPKAGCVAAGDRQVLVIDRIVDFAIDDSAVYYTRGSVLKVRK